MPSILRTASWRVAKTILTATILLGGLEGVKSAAIQNANPTDRVPAAEARKRIEANMSYIDNRLKEMDALYGFRAGPQTLKEAFKKQGVTFSLRYADNRGINLGWDKAVYFYSIHRQILYESLRTIPPTGYVGQSQLAYLDRGMRAWKANEQQLQSLFRDTIDLYTREALNYDKQVASGVNIYSAKDLHIPLKLEAKQINDAYDMVWQRIRDIKDKRLFEPIKKWVAGPFRKGKRSI
jgi:hypothetical protein